MSKGYPFKRPLGSIVTLRDLRRPDPSREPRAVMLIVCEGRKTEPQYFNSLCQHLGLTTVEVEIVGDEVGSAPITVVDSAIARRDQRVKNLAKLVGKAEFDAIWCVIDIEAPGTNSSLARAVDKAKANGLELALSNPCFEYWILLHFVDTCKPFKNCAEVITEVRRYYSGYGKGKPCFHAISANTANAIKLSRKQLKLKPGDKYPNPSTFVHELVEKLQAVAHRD